MSAVTFLKRVAGFRREDATEPVIPAPVSPEPVIPAFDHGKAQRYEWANNEQTIIQSFGEVYSAVDENLASGGIWHSANDQFFDGDVKLFDRFVDHIRERKCLEIGSGPFGFLPPARWIKDRNVIEPLADKYRESQIKLLGKTFFTQDLNVHVTEAENLLPELVGKVDGAIICRNALDHCDDPLTILLNMSKYAASGCYLLVWTDLWHLQGLDDGHHNMTKSPEVMDALLRGLGFDLLKRGRDIRDQSEYIEYGRIARKR